MSIGTYNRFLLAAILTLVFCSCKNGNTNTQASAEGEETMVSGFLNTKTEPQTKSASSSFTYVRGGKGVILKRTAYTVSYNKETRCPNWVAWHLTKNHTQGSYKRDGMKFTEDEEVKTPRATNSDYYRSGYDRGHMCPSGDNKWSYTTQKESFLFTNICPQNHDLDAGVWNDLEQACRHWANIYGEVWIVCGPVYKGSNHKKIGKNKVVVPEQFFKVVLTKKNGRYLSLGFLYDNKGGRKPMAEYVRTVDEIEEITGFDFFSALPDNIENSVEAEAILRDWKK